VSEQSVTIYWPAVSIVGAATPECFFEACTAKDLESGFANRLLILPYEGIRRPPLQDTPRRADVPPKELVERLRKLPKQTGIGQSILDKPLDGPEGGLPKRERVDWGAGASEVYFALSAKMDALEDCGDRSRFELGMRTCEHAVRLATIVAVGRGASRVEREDIEWATQFAEVGWEAACGGYAKYVQDHFGFAKFCEKVLEKSVQFGGWRSERDLARDFRPNNKYGFELTNALKQLQREERIEGVTEETPGRSSPGFQLLKDEG
jgi:hypothetical protein